MSSMALGSSVNKRTILGFIAVALLALIFALPSLAYAGDSTSDGNGGNHTGSGTGVANDALGSVRWRNLTGEIRNDIANAGYPDVRNAQVGQYVAVPYYDTRPNLGFKYHAWFRWNTIIRLWEISENMTKPNQGLDGRLLTYMLDKGYSIQTKDRRNDFGTQHVRWWWSGREFVDAVWISERVVQSQDSGSCITYVEDDNGVIVDDRDKSAEWLYNNGKSKADYHDKTDPNEHNYKNDIYAEITNVVKHIKEYQKMDDNGNWYTYKTEVWYEKTGTTSSKKTITYKTNAPTITQEKYRPYNLNRNSYATAEDISADYANASKSLSAEVDNKQGITDNKELQSLDINNATEFKFKFNTPFGMPDEYNWNNTPADLANGTWEPASGGSYANGKNDPADADGRLRSNLKFFASISSNTKDPSKDSSSLISPDSKEVLSNEFYSKLYQGEGSFSGGDWSARFTLNDKYNTDNNQESSFEKWWINKYDESRFYEYGTEYWGNITLSGVQDPYKVSHGTGVSNGSKYDITITADNDERGLYVGVTTMRFEQPVLFGKWSVKTVAGDIN